jgi:ADP-heptose:LPS heptosyltransferase
MGDVALTTPVLKGMREQYPEVELLMVTRPMFKPFFSSVKGLQFIFPDFKRRHKGFLGLIWLFKDIRRQSQIDYVIDLHDVLRSKILRFFFRLKGVPAAVIDKGRSEKSSLINGKKKKQLKHTVERYCDTFARAGFNVTPTRGISIIPDPEQVLKTELLSGRHNGLNIGIAPYAKHKLKMWPEQYMIRLLEQIGKNYKCRFWLFGGEEDSGKLFALQCRIAGSISLVGKLSLNDELIFMSKLDLMISMDSANMHMAALVGTKVISIWGGTDPLAGFSAWMQPDSYSIRIPVEDLKCRPCTIYGKGYCKRLDFACMHWLTPEIVFQKIEKLVLQGLSSDQLAQDFPLKGD